MVKKKRKEKNKKRMVSFDVRSILPPRLKKTGSARIKID